MQHAYSILFNYNCVVVVSNNSPDVDMTIDVSFFAALPKHIIQLDFSILFIYPFIYCVLVIVFKLLLSPINSACVECFVILF